MKSKLRILPLKKDRFNEAVELVLATDLDTRDEIEGHLKHMAAHYVAIVDGRVVGVIGWYQDNVKYATDAMGDAFPGEEAYWVGFFAVDKYYRGKGIGYALFKKLEDVLKKKGVNELWVASVPETRDYYQRQGFVFFMNGEITGKPHVFLVKRSL